MSVADASPMGFVGRATERAAVRRHVAGVLTPRPAVVWVEGEAGSGKSALVDAIVDELPTEVRLRRADADEATPDEPGVLLAGLGATGSGEGGPLGLGLRLHAHTAGLALQVRTLLVELGPRDWWVGRAPRRGDARRRRTPRPSPAPPAGSLSYPP